ncbi:hypothetical protein BS78_04G057100 [Paspalum vaginatum]|nr:hypothetical protein BS78_04G057100 [Paspalum vaginatum]
MEASAAAGDPSPPPPRRWLSGLVSSASRLLAAILDPESSASDTTSSSPESSQPLPRRDHDAADHGTGKCFPSDNHQQLNLSGNEIVLKDSGEGSFAIVSEVDPKDAVKQLLMQETYSRAECDALVKIIQERVVDAGDEPAAIILPIAWQANTQQYPVAYSSSPNTSFPAASGIPAYSPVFETAVEKEWLKKSSAVAEGPCTSNHDRSQPVLKRSNSNIGEECRRIRPKQNRSNTLRNRGASSEKPTCTLSGFQEDTRKRVKFFPFVGSDNLTFSRMASEGVFDGEPSAVTAQHFTSISCQADRDKRCSAMSCPYSSRDQTETARIHLVQRNETRDVPNSSCYVSRKAVLQVGVEEGESSSSMGMQPENSSRNSTRGFSLHNSTPTKRRSRAFRAHSSNNHKTVRSWGGLPQQSDPAAGQESGTGRVQAKRPVGRLRKERR